MTWEICWLKKSDVGEFSHITKRSSHLLEAAPETVLLLEWAGWLQKVTWENSPTSLRRILSVYKTKTAILCSQKIRMSLLGRKKAPAGALSPSTVLLRGILSVSKTKTAILCYQKIRMSLFGRKKPLRARSALAPSFLSLQHINFVFIAYKFCLYNI